MCKMIHNILHYSINYIEGTWDVWSKSHYLTQHRGREMIWCLVLSLRTLRFFLSMPHLYYVAQHSQVWYRVSQPSLTVVLFSLGKTYNMCTHKAECLNLS